MTRLDTKYYTNSQKLALARLHELHKIQGTTSYAGFHPVNRALLIGATGNGKTAVMRAYAQSLRWPLLTISSSSWMIYGSATTPHSIQVCRDFVRANHHGVIYIDEIDKCVPGGAVHRSTWSLGVFGELLSLISAAESLRTMGWEPRDIARYRQNYELHAAGTWQGIAEDLQRSKNKGAMGFTVSNGHRPSYVDLVSASDQIPAEVTRRFHPEPLVISSPTRSDYRDAISRIHDELRHPCEIKDELLDEAVSAHLGMRWIEQYLTRLLIENPNLRRYDHADDDEEEVTARTLTKDEYAHIRRRLADWTLEIRRSLLLLKARSPSYETGIKSAELLELWKGVEEDSIVSLSRELWEVIEPCETGGVAHLSRYGVEVMGRFVHVLQEGLEKHAPAIEKAGCLEAMVNLYELVDRIRRVIKSLIGAQLQENAAS